MGFKASTDGRVCVKDSKCTMFEFLDEDGECYECNPGSIASDDHESCVYNPRLYDVYKPKDDMPDAGEETNEPEDVECEALQKKVNRSGMWTCEFCPPYTKGDGEFACIADTCEENEILRSDGTCMRCEEGTRASSDGRYCASDRKCEKN